MLFSPYLGENCEFLEVACFIQLLIISEKQRFQSMQGKEAEGKGKLEVNLWQKRKKIANAPLGKIANRKSPSPLGRLRFFPFLPKVHFQFPFPFLLSLPLPFPFHVPPTFRLR